MSHSEATKPEAQVEEHVEPAREDSSGLTQREFLKKLVGGAAGITGLAAAGTLLTPKTAEAAYSTGGAPYAFPAPTTTGDQITTNLHVNGHVSIKGYRPWIDVTAFGASGDWTPYADAAVAAAIAAAPYGCVIYFPPGVYNFQNPISIVNKHVTIMGAGRGVTLFWCNPGAGLNISLSDPARITIRDIQLQAGGGHNPHPAISMVSASWYGGPLLAPHIHDVLIDAAEGSSWSKGINLINVTGARIQRFQIGCGGAVNSTHGIHLWGGGANAGSTIASITDGYIFDTQVGIGASDRLTEGLYIRAIEVLGSNIGYLLDAPGPGSAISDCHAATTQAGIKLVDHGDMALMGNLLYGQTDGWSGIDCHGTGIDPQTGNPNVAYGTHNLRIIGNQITRNGGGVGIKLSGYARNCVIQGNVLGGVATGIVLTGPNVTGSVVVNNRIDTGGTPISSSAPPAPTNITNPNY